MSPITAKLAAVEILQKVQQDLLVTPSYWVSAVEEKAHLERYRLTLRYLQTSYAQVPSVLPTDLFDKDSDEQGSVRRLLERLQSFCNEGAEKVRSVLGPSDDQLTSVPKYYYSELRHSRRCALPQAPKALSEKGLLGFLGVEAVASLRSAERFRLLAEQRGAEVPAEAWEEFGQRASNAAVEVVSTMVLIFGEKRTISELEACIKAEKTVCESMLTNMKNRMRSSSNLLVPLGESSDFEEDEDSSQGDGTEFCSVLAYKPIFIVSDCTGESAEKTVQSALGQFAHCFDRSCPTDITTWRFTHIDMVKDIVRKAKEREAFVVFTLVEPATNARMVKCCEELGVEYYDLWSPLLEKLEGFYDVNRLGVPGRRQVTDERYMQLIDCIEYTRTLDDGVNPKRWNEADIIIIGPSRSGKTPLAFFMAQRGFKVANYPLVPGEELPPQLFEFDQDCIFALSIAPKKLAGIRNTRMETLKMSARSNYAQLSKVQEEVDWCRKLYREHPRWSVIDTTDSGIEENCAKILMVLERLGKVRSRIDYKQNPSAI